MASVWVKEVNYFDGVVMGSCLPEIVKSEALSWADIKPGLTMKAKVEAIVNQTYVQVSLNPYL